MEFEYAVVSERPAQMWIPGPVMEDRLDAEFYQPVYLRALKGIQSTGYPVNPLEKLSTKKARVWWGIKGLDKPQSATHIPYLRPNEVEDDGWVEYDKLTTIDQKFADEMPQGLVKSGDLLVEVKGNARKVHVVRDDVPPVTFVSGSMYRYTIGAKANAYYLWAYLSSKTCQTLKERLMSNSIIQWINPDDICHLPVPKPDRPVQDYIGAKVQLAERCRERANELWVASQQLLSEGANIPLAAEILGQIDHSGLQSTSYYLATIMPMAAWVRSDLIEHELGPQYFHPRRANVISKLHSSGVELKHLAEVATRKSERVTAEKVRRMAHYVGLAEIDSTTGYFDPISPQTAEVTGTSSLFKPGDILFSKLRPYLNKVSICPDYIAEACGSTELLVYRAHTSIRPYYVFFAVKSNLGLFQIIDVTAGSTLPRVDPEVIDDILVPIISNESQELIDKNIRSVFKLRHYASGLIEEAKADIEALIEGRLDVNAILAGRLKPPVWEAIEV